MGAIALSLRAQTVEGCIFYVWPSSRRSNAVTDRKWRARWRLHEYTKDRLKIVDVGKGSARDKIKLYACTAVVVQFVGDLWGRAY